MRASRSSQSLTYVHDFLKACHSPLKTLLNLLHTRCFAQNGVVPDKAQMCSGSLMQQCQGLVRDTFSGWHTMHANMIGQTFTLVVCVCVHMSLKITVQFPPAE